MGRIVSAIGAMAVVSWSLAFGAQKPASKQASDGPTAREFKAAVAAYDAGKYQDAAAHLEPLQTRLAQNFQFHELLGLTYAAEAHDADALNQLQIAARLAPDSAAAQANLGTALTRAGHSAEAEQEFLKALAIDPANYSANRSMAAIYLSSNRVADAVPLLEACEKARPGEYDTLYDLALANLVTGNLQQARSYSDQLASQRDTGELHNLLGRIDEKEGKYLDAANEFAKAAHLDPSEDNLFVWASELLLHRTYDPSIEVFQDASARYPKSQRLLVGLGMALYSRGEYDKSIHALLAATDIDPADPRCYLFLSKAYLSSPGQAEDIIQRFRRYTELEPQNARAWYYYALSLWKGRRLEESSVDYKQIESLLLKSIALDDTFADSHLQLGILYNDQHDYQRAFPQYERSLELNANLPDTHYRLGQYYVHAGDKSKAQSEFDLYKRLQAEHQALVDKERAEVQQFVLSTNTGSSAKP